MFNFHFISFSFEPLHGVFGGEGRVMKPILNKWKSHNTKNKSRGYPG